MNNLINFIIRKSHWFLFVILEVISFVLLFRFNNYQGSIYFTSANAVAGSINEAKGDIKSYFNLRATNEALLDRNTTLQLEIEQLKERLSAAALDTATIPLSNFEVKRARVIKNSVNKPDNYITLNKGRKDGIFPDMGVIGPEGIVGIVYMTSENRAIVISLLNSKSNISCKVKNSNYFGNLTWDGGDPQYASLKDIPRHATFHKGDTIVTSGYSAVFPEGIPVGVIENVTDSDDGLFYNLHVELFTDFGILSDVRVINDRFREEERELELQTNKTSGTKQ